MTTYVVKVSCSDCTGIDDMGCGDGEPWYLTGEDFMVRKFDTREAAEAAGWKCVSDVGPWEFEVEESES